MGNISRKQLITGGAGGALALGALGASAAPAAAHDDDGRRGLHVHVHGVLHGVGPTPSTVLLAVSLDVAGRRRDLAGAGWDSGTGSNPNGMVPTGNFPVGPIGACYYTAAGRLQRGQLTLEGTSLFTNRPTEREEGKSDTRADGRTLNATADRKTGRITWSLSPEGGFFEGDGTVVVIGGDD
jgi:hypothetical protein